MRFPTRVIDRSFRVLNGYHRAAARVSGGRWGQRAFGMEIIELVTVGRRSARPHSTLLTVPVIEGATLILVASKGGDDRDPDWLRNGISTPAVEVVRHGERRRMSARLATREECARLWPLVVARYRPYDRYRRRATSEIPLVICEPEPTTS